MPRNNGALFLIAAASVTYNPGTQGVVGVFPSGTFPMRAYFTSSNFVRAAYIGGVASLMAWPRLFLFDREVLSAKTGGFNMAQAEALILVLALVAFPLLTLIAGAATAWGKRGGMSGPIPGWREALPWAVGAAITGFLLMPIMLLGDQWRQLALSGSCVLNHARDIPKEPDVAIALILWSAGFETVLFQAGVMSFVARLTDREDAAIVCGMVFRLFVVFSQCSRYGLGPVAAMVAAGSVATTGIACFVYARGGLPAAMVFNGILSGRHLLVVLTLV